MEKTFKSDSNLWELRTDKSHILHRIGSDDYTDNRQLHVTPEDLDNWEEIAVSDIPAYTETDYKTKVAELIHQRYSLDDEIALRANLEDDPTDKRVAEYADYLAYRKECKQRAKQILVLGSAAE